MCERASHHVVMLWSSSSSSGAVEKGQKYITSSGGTQLSSLSQLRRPLFARQPHPIRVEARISGKLEPFVLRRSNRNCQQSAINDDAKHDKKTGLTKPCPSTRAKDLLPVRPHAAEPPHVTLAPDTAVLGIPCLTCAAPRPEVATQRRSLSTDTGYVQA